MKKLKRLLIVIVAITLIAFITTTILNYTSGKKLKNALQQIKDRGEPLSIEEMFPKKGVTDRENAELMIQIVQRLMWRNNTYERLEEIKSSKILDNYCDNPDDAELKIRAMTELQNILEENADIMNFIDEAVALGKYRFYPTVRDNPLMTVLPHMAPLQKSCKLLSLKALYLATNNKPDDALESIQDILVLSNYLKNSYFVIEPLVQVNMHKEAVMAVERVLNISNPSPELCSALAEQIAISKGLVDLTRAFMGERATKNAVYNGLRTGRFSLIGMEVITPKQKYSFERRIIRLSEKIRPDFIWNYDELRNLHILNMAIQYSTMPYSKEREEILNSEIQSIPKIFLGTRRLLPAIIRVMHIITEGEARLSSAEIALRLIVYKDKNSEFPETLDELDEEIPLDPFTGKSFFYRRGGEGFVVYSVGKNLVDDGGYTKRDRHSESKDVGFRYRYSEIIDNANIQ